MTATEPPSSALPPLDDASRTGPVALVAGASRGLGLLIARDLAASGCRPVLCARDAGELDAAVALMAGWGHACRAMVCDVTDHRAVEDLVGRVEREAGPVDISIHVAGVIQVGPLAALTREHFTQAIDVMTWGPINLALAVLPGMRARGRGRIATVTSVGGMVSVPHLLPYSTAKFAAVGFSQGLRAELAGSGITVTTVVPGLMRTGSHLFAQFAGDQRAEYAWFASAASLPLLSLDADRAAAKIVRGILAGRGVVILTPLAKIGARFAGVAPATTSALLGLTARVLPKAPGMPRAPGAPGAPGAPHAPGGTIPGHEARALLGSPLVERLTTLGTRAARRLNEMRRP